jgi:multiple sugar transport system substrate-binding protein
MAMSFITFLVLGFSLASAQVKTIRYIGCSYPQMMNEIKKQVAEYEKMHPDVKVDVERVDWGEVVTKVTAAAAAGSPYDIVDTGISENQWVLQQAGLFQPLTDVVMELGGEDYISPGALKRYKGEYWMIPRVGFVFHLLYRKDLFEKKGLEPPKDWKEYLECAKKLTEDTDGDGKVDRWGTIMPIGSNYFPGIYMFNLMIDNGGHLLDEKGKVVFDSPQNIETIKFIQELYKYSPPGSATYQIVDMRTAFYHGRAAMSWYSTLMLSTDVKDQSNPLYGKVGISIIPPAKRGGSFVLRTGYSSNSLSKDTKYPKEAKGLIKYMMGVDQIIDVHLAQPSAFSIPVKKAAESPRIWSNPTVKLFEKEYREYLDLANKYGQEIGIFEHKDVLNLDTSKIINALAVNKVVQDVILQRVPPEKAVKEGDAKMKEVIGK